MHIGEDELLGEERITARPGGYQLLRAALVDWA